MAKAKILKFDAAGPGLSKSEILKVCEAENVRFMRLQFTDILGVDQERRAAELASSRRRSTARSCSTAPRSRASPASRSPTCTSCRISTPSRSIPWAHRNGEKVGRLICDIYTPDGNAVRRLPAHEPAQADGQGVGPRLHDGHGPGGRVLPVPPRRERAADHRHARRGRLLRPDPGRPRRGGPARHRPRPRGDGLRGRGGAPRGGRRPARDRLQVRRRVTTADNVTHVPLRRQEGRARPRPARDVHAEADLRHQRLGHARPPVASSTRRATTSSTTRRRSTSSRRRR